LKEITPKYDRSKLIAACVKQMLPPCPSHIKPDDILSRINALDSDLKSQWKHKKKILAREILGTLLDKDGVQFIRVELHLLPVFFTITSGVISGVWAINWYGINDYSAWAAVFDEVRPNIGKIEIRPVYKQSLGATSLICAGVLDYDDSGTVSTFADLVKYDSAKIFDAAPISDTNYAWFADFRHQPDTQFVTTAADKGWAWFKYGNVTAPSITTGTQILMGYGKMNLTFRQVD